VHLFCPVYYNRAMEQEMHKVQDDDLNKNSELVKLESLIKSMNEAVTAQKAYFDKHTAAMEKLTLAIKQLDQTLKKEINLESHQNNLHLEELIKLFVEYDINPEFYHEYKMLKPAPPTQGSQLVKRKKPR
jgi:hypothetical protein